MSEDFQKALMRWDKEPGRLNMTHKIARAMLNRTSPGGNEVLLDYGTGTGLIALEFLHSVKKIVAVDSSKDMLTFLQKKLNADSNDPLKKPILQTPGFPLLFPSTLLDPSAPPYSPPNRCY